MLIFLLKVSDIQYLEGKLIVYPNVSDKTNFPLVYQKKQITSVFLYKQGILIRKTSYVFYLPSIFLYILSEHKNAIYVLPHLNIIWQKLSFRFTEQLLIVMDYW